MYKKQTILAVIGASGSGKTTFTLALTRKYGIKNVVSCTTRPRRACETDGIEHWFRTAKDVPPAEQRLAYTKFGDYEYWVALNDVEALGDMFTYVIDEDGLIDLKNHYGEDFNVISIKVNREDTSGIDAMRKQRDEGRFRMTDSDFDIVLNNNTTIDELCEEFMARLQNLRAIRHKYEKTNYRT